MKLLFITSNSNFLKPESPERAWLKSVSSLTNALHVIVLTSKDRSEFTFSAFLRWFLYSGKNLWSVNPHGLLEKIDDHTWLYATDSFLPSLREYKALDIIKAHVIWKKIPQVTTVLSDDPFLAGSIGLNFAKRYKLDWRINIEKDFWIGKYTPIALSNIFDNANKIAVFSVHAEAHLKKVAGNQINLNKIILLPRTHSNINVAEMTITVDLKKKYHQYNYIILVTSSEETNRHIGVINEAVEMIKGRYPLAGLVITPPELLDKDLVSYMKTANVYFSLASSDEDDYNLILAATVGCPIIAVKTAFSENLITDEENGLLLPQLTAQGLFSTLIRLNETPGLRERLKINSSMYANASLSKTPQEYEARMKEFFSEVEEENK